MNPSLFQLQLCELLNKLPKYDLEWFGLSYMQSQHMEESKCGEWLKTSDLADAFGLKYDNVTGEYKA